MKKILSILVLVVSLVWLSSVAFAEDDTEDQEVPNDVENVTATASGNSITVSWDEALDNVATTGYGIGYGSTTVTASSPNFDLNTDVANVTEHTFTDLDSDTTYFFGLYAYDAAGNESVSWSNIAEATTEAESTDDESTDDESTDDDTEVDDTEVDTEAPQVVSVEALNKEEVEIVFSEEVVLADEDPQDAFSIENQSDFTMLDVNEAIMDEDDEDNKTVILSTATQEANVEYKITVGIDLKDLAGNPIVSGTSDTGSFTGTDTEKDAEVEVSGDGPQLVKIETVNDKNIIVSFDKTIVLDVNPEDNFVITADDDETVVLNVVAVQLVPGIDGVTDAAAIVETDSQDDITYLLTIVDIADENGNLSGSDGSSLTFDGIKKPASAEPTTAETTTPETTTAEATNGDASTEEITNGETEEPEEDTEAPLDVTNLTAKAVFEAQKYVVELNWDNPEDNAGDTVKQILYMSVNDEDGYDKKADIDADNDNYDYKGLEPGEYYFKLTQEDAAGNESEGTTIKVVLSETGPGVVALVLASVGLGRVVGRKKRK